ncbi:MULTISPECIES: flagellar hook assembly protein FlgD [unclassified Janthinobacterium]|uniref:flagellar hook assembly protein FlgD n=1 Tax=unclassified Janthinobacterium TaxID=2610881 RepID=UPI001E56AA07|nr:MULTISPECIES: flagellar hook assembly protein FlgD [unclassified Janthinobacterium]MCC7643678.1 flagellar hook assembly protein FlgD [Janthinobacterium sp. EB271-G4-3-1]MCC7691354.1 flagellar hook assembly protein FlgD [Janthinobacterium sp. EB271-G4-3-2]
MATIDTSTATVTDLMATMNPKKNTAAKGSVEEETNKFLTLLVTQLQNQDPMNPLDNAQLTSQLAQLSTVTGVNKLNTTLETLKTSYQQAESMQAANIIGHGVLTAGKNITLSKSAALLGVDLATPADSVKVIIYNSTGKEVHSIDLGPQDAGTLPLGWNGSTAELDKDGKNIVLPDGAYTFSVEAKRGGAKLTDAAALMFGSVASVSTGAGGVKLNVPGVGSITMADVKQIL